MMEHYTHDNWPTWLAQLSTPFTEITCGEDLKYEEDFKFLKSSFSTVDEPDCKQIFITGTQLTAEKSKDLRIVSYILFSAAGEYGVEGLTQGFTLLNRFVEQFWSDVHPLKEKARKAIHTWLLNQQNRIIALAENQGQFEPDQIIDLQAELAIYGEHTIKRIDQEAGPLSDLVSWAEKLSKKYPVIVPEVVAKPDVTEVKNSPKSEPSQLKTSSEALQELAPVAPVVLEQVIDSDAEFSEALRKLLAFDKEKQNLARFGALARAGRWANMQLPANEQGKTRLPAPRKTAFTPITNALANKDYLTAYLLGEALFMEGAMHFNLDLQAMQLNALKGLDDAVLAKQLEFSLYQLITRFPQLSQLTYDDGSMLCSAKTKDLLSDIVALFGQASQSSEQGVEVFEQTEGLAKTQVEQGKLDHALVLLNGLATSNTYERSKVILSKAKMCLLAERYDFAAPMLSELLAVIEKHQLSQWQPNFCMQVWRNAVLCFDTLAVDGNEILTQQSQDLKQKMILTQPEVALGWI